VPKEEGERKGTDNTRGERPFFKAEKRGTSSSGEKKVAAQEGKKSPETRRATQTTEGKKSRRENEPAKGRNQEEGCTKAGLSGERRIPT